MRVVARAQGTRLSNSVRAVFRNLAGCALIAAAVVAFALSISHLYRIAPPSLWWQAVFLEDTADLRAVVVHDSWLPRVVIAWLAGAMLGLAGAIFQQVLRNPIAEPMTLGVSAGAQLAMTLATIFAPGLIVVASQSTALAGAAVASAAVFVIAWRSGLSPVSVAVSGMVVSLFCGSIGIALQLLHAPYAHALFIWGGGSLAQQGWSNVATLGPECVAAVVLAFALLRPMVLLGLDDSSTNALGFSVRRARLAALALAIALGGAVVGAVGIIGFVGLAAPAIARLSGARRLGPRLILSAVCGAIMLWFTDELVQLASGALGDVVPAGAATALFGTPIMLMTMARMRGQGGAGARPMSLEIGSVTGGAKARSPNATMWTLSSGAAISLGILACALLLGRNGHGWHWATPAEFAKLATWRLPRTIAAMSAGAMLASAGVMMQRLTGNPLASPELLGASGGAALGLVAFMLCTIGASASMQLVAAACGAFATLIVLLWLAFRAHFAPERVVLAGISIGALSQAVIAVAVAAGGERAVAILTWLSGSTYSITRHDAVIAAAFSVVLCGAAPLLQRWLTLFSLGESHARSLGVPVMRARLIVLLFIALSTGAATLVVGPLSFVGLIAPHFARLVGARRLVVQQLVAVVAGALVMALADWLGREWLMPRELPAGLMASLIGTPYLMWRLARRR